MLATIDLTSCLISGLTIMAVAYGRDDYTRAKTIISASLGIQSWFLLMASCLPGWEPFTLVAISKNLPKRFKHRFTNNDIQMLAIAMHVMSTLAFVNLQNEEVNRTLPGGRCGGPGGSSSRQCAAAGRGRLQTRRGRGSHCPVLEQKNISAISEKRTVTYAKIS